MQAVLQVIDVFGYAANKEKPAGKNAGISCGFWLICVLQVYWTGN
jgi:hypothetical protein